MRILRGLLPGDIIIIIIIISGYFNFLLPMNFRSSDLLKNSFFKDFFHVRGVGHTSYKFSSKEGGNFIKRSGEIEWN